MTFLPRTEFRHDPGVAYGTPEDAATLHRFIVDLAVYEKEPDAVEVTPEILAAQMKSARPPFESLIAELDGRDVGFALFFTSYSTWRGLPGLYLEDLFVVPEARGHGVGKALLQKLAKITVQRGYGRFEWSVLDWNQDAIDFYNRLGAASVDGWIRRRLSREALKSLAHDE